jgi:integrase
MNCIPKRPNVEADKLTKQRPCARGGRLYRGGARAENIWTVADEAAMLERAPSHLHLPLLLALWTGQRQGDLLRLPWSAYDGTHIRLRQSKNGRRVVIPVGAPLRAALEAAARRSTIILTNSDGKPWTSDGFRASWGKACKGGAGVVGVTFHDLRGTAVTRLAVAGRTEAEISPPSPGTRWLACAQSSIRTTSPAIQRLAKARSESSKREQILPTDLPTGEDVLGEERLNPLKTRGGRTRTRTLDPLIKSQA